MSPALAGSWVHRLWFQTLRFREPQQEQERRRKAERIAIPHRGQVCEPAFTADTAWFVATLRGQSLEALAEVTTRNFFKLFGKAA